MATPDDRRTDGAAPTHVHIEKKPVNWLAWILLALGLLALLWWLIDRNSDDAVVAAPVAMAPAPVAEEVVATTPNAVGATALAGTSGLDSFLAGTEAAPRSFTFEKLNFDTAQSDVRAADADEVNTVAGVLSRYPTARIRIAGYADARGANDANNALGKARADAVKAALVAKGVDEGRIETVSGGESDPVDTNATASGQAENRRTELAVTQR